MPIIIIVGVIHLECHAHFFLITPKLPGYDKNVLELCKLQTELQKWSSQRAGPIYSIFYLEKRTY